MADTTQVIDTRHESAPVLSDPAKPLARLVVLVGSQAGRRYPLGATDVTIGRAESCTLRIPEPKISRQHLKLQYVDNKFVVRDLGSRNGTLVNGKRIDSAVLTFGDRIQLAQNSLLLFTRVDPLEDILFHRQQMEVVGQLAAGIAHDFNNLLNVILSSGAHLKSLRGTHDLSDPDVVECHADIEAAAQRGAELTAKLLTLSRRRAGQMAEVRAVNISVMCHDVLHLAKRTFESKVLVEAEIDPDLWVDGDAGALHQVLMNLCINARDAMNAGGTLKLRACSEEDEGKSLVVIRLSDTGIGMDEATRARVFEPFFTTKEKGTGTGLGLSTVYEIVTSHGGIVGVESDLGKGSQFEIRLPSTHRRSKRKGRSGLHKTFSDIEDSKTTNALVLVVDDQELVRRSLGRLLKAAGNRVIFASDGKEALETYVEKRPDVVLMDLDMPVLSGEEALKRMKELNPDARVLLISGYHDAERRSRLLRAGAADFLEKPVDARRLVEAVRLVHRG